MGLLLRQRSPCGIDVFGLKGELVPVHSLRIEDDDMRKHWLLPDSPYPTYAAYLEAVGVRAVELAKDWRTDRTLRRLEALMVVADQEHSFLLSGTGDVIEPDDGVLAIGSGGPYALAAARALVQHSDLSAPQIVQQAMEIAGSIDIHTNREIFIEEIKV